MPSKRFTQAIAFERGRAVLASLQLARTAVAEGRFPASASSPASSLLNHRNRYALGTDGTGFTAPNIHVRRVVIAAEAAR